ITFIQKPNQNDKTLTATVERPKTPDAQEDPEPKPSQKKPTPEAPQLPNSIPPVLKQLGIRIKVEQNRLSLLELYGKVDFQTALEDKIKNEEDGSSDEADSLELKHVKHSENQDGVVDFKITYQYDRATKATKYALSLGSDED